MSRERNSRYFFVGLFICFLLASSCPLALAEDVQVNSVLDKRTAQINEEIHLTIRILGAQGNIQAPHLSTLKGFETYYTGRASHISFVNNVSSTSVEFSYVLVPKTAGRFTLASIEVSADGKVFHTDPADIEISGDRNQPSQRPPGAPPFPSNPVPYAQPQSQTPPPSSQAGPPSQEPPPSFQPEDENIFVKAWVDKISVYPNEQILLSYSLYTRYDTRYEGFTEEPAMSGFWIEEFPMEREVNRETVRVGGKRYVKADIRKIALFPTASADYTIQPGILKASIRQEPENNSVFDEFFNDSFFSGSGFFSRRENRLLKPPAISITVKPFPEEGKPSNFQGAVGNFRITATLDKKTVKQNEPVSMSLVIEGEGNIETLKQPALPALDEFKVYESDTSSQLFKTGNVIGGRKNFEIVFIPIKAGNLVIPKMEFSFFSPQQKRYATVSTQEVPIHVEPSDQPYQVPKELSQQEIFKKDIKMEGQDVRYIQEKLPDETSGKIFDLIYWVLITADFGLTLLILFGLLQARKEKVFAKDNALKRRKQAKTQAANRISRLKSLSRPKDHSHTMAYFEEIDKILTQYLSDKFNFSAYGTTRMDLERALAEALGTEDSLYQSILELYRICDESRFGKVELPPHLKADALKILKQTISRVEKLRR